MSTRIQRIAITNFKAFREFSLDLEGRHLLLYGANGSGKSSLYWALYTFLQSARKRSAEVHRYFDPAEPERLLNIHEDEAARPGEIAVTLRDTNSGNDTIYSIGKEAHGTHNQPVILKGDLASDFITYRFFFGFSHFRNSQRFDLWPLFEREILPFCVSTGGGSTPYASWNRIKSGVPNPYGSRGLAGTQAYQTFKSRTDGFASMLTGIIDSISREAQAFYDEYFSDDDPAPVVLKLGVTTSPAYHILARTFTHPIIEFGIQIDGKTIAKPQAFLNEAKLTQLALAIRFSASRVNLHESGLKLLVLDDLLVSLDMSNRMKVVEILLSESFADYQKIILTHDRGFFQEFRRLIGDHHQYWCFRSLTGNARNGIGEQQEKNALEKASDYLNGYSLDEAALQLRKAAEETAKRYRSVAMKQTIRPGEFHSLTEDLKAVRNDLQQKIPMDLYQRVLRGTPSAYRDRLVSSNDDDIDNDSTLDAETKGKLKAQRRHLRQFLSQAAWRHLETIEVVDQVIRMKDRVLNPAAHWGEAPLYDAELRKALRLVERLQRCLNQDHRP